MNDTYDNRPTMTAKDPQWSLSSFFSLSEIPEGVKNRGSQIIGKLRLQTVLTICFVLVVIFAISITGFFAFQASQFAVQELAGQVLDETSYRISDQLRDYLKTPHLVNQLCMDSIALGSLHVHDNAGLKSYFRNLSFRFDTIEAICYANEADGNYTIISKVGAPGIVNGTERFYGISNSQTNHSFTEYRLLEDGSLGEKTLIIPEYDPRTRPWYQAAVQAQGPAWTPVYMWLEGVVSIDAASPVYSSQGLLMGVMDTSLTLNGIGDFLQNLKISEHGQAFIIDTNGKIIAASTIQEPYIRENGDIALLNASDCNDPIIEEVTEVLSKNNTLFSSLTSRQQFTSTNGTESHLVQVSRYQDPYGLDWLIVVVIPESDFMGRIHDNNTVTLLLLICIIIGTVLLCILLARYITRPILAMSRSAKAFAHGDFSSWTYLDRGDELGELSHTFKHMAEQLQKMFLSLKASEERYMGLFQASADAIILCKDNTILEMNHAAEEMFSISNYEARGKNISELFDEAGPVIYQMIQSSYTTGTEGYESRILTRSTGDHEQYLNIRVTNTTTNDQILNLVHIRDITMERQAIISSAEKEALREA